MSSLYLSRRRDLYAAPSSETSTLYSSAGRGSSTRGCELPPRGRGGSRGHSPGRGESRCTHCQQTNHTMDRCWALHCKPDWASHVLFSLSTYMVWQHWVSGYSIVSFRSTGVFDWVYHCQGPCTCQQREYDFLLNKMQPTTTFDVATLIHTGISCLTSSTSSSWIIDSGASIHLTGKSTLFSTFNPSSIAYIFTLADGSSKFITGTGTVHPTSSLVLFDAP